MIKLNILYEDNHIIVVEKPINILSQSDITGDTDMLTILKEYIKEKYNKPGNVYLGLVHRLDRPVGGIMVFAKTSKAASRLNEQIRERTFEKTYLAVVYDNDLKDNGTFEDHILKLDDGNSVVSDKGKLSKLTYQVLERKKNKALVEIHLETGRHHQIRVQFASRGFPLCGDQRYGRMDKTQIALYAYRLKFLHPTTKETMEFMNVPTSEPYWTQFTMSNIVKSN